MIRLAAAVLCCVALSGCVGTVVGAAANTAVGVTGAVAGAGVKATGKVVGATGRAVFVVQPEAPQ